jgi:hypothetical protein
VERGIVNGTIPEGTEIFLFTDNFVTEWAFDWGTSSSKTLFKLVLRLHQLEMEECKLFIHLIWVAGNRMFTRALMGPLGGSIQRRYVQEGHA